MIKNYRNLQHCHVWQIYQNTLYFDYPSGEIRSCKIYGLEELKSMKNESRDAKRRWKKSRHLENTKRKRREKQK